MLINITIVVVPITLIPSYNNHPLHIFNDKPRTNIICRNPSFRLTTKARACKVAGLEGSPRITLHGSGSVGK